MTRRDDIKDRFIWRDGDLDFDDNDGDEGEPVEKYSEDELRDDHGRWTVGGGESAPGPIRTYDHMAYFSDAHQDKILAQADKVDFDTVAADHRLTALAERSRTPEHDSRWYYDRHDECIALAKRTGLSTKEVIGIVAAMSPLNDWEANWDDAVKIAEQWHANPTYTITEADRAAVITYDEHSRVHKGDPTVLPIGTFHLRDMDANHVTSLSALRDIGLPRGINYRENMEKALLLADGGRPDEWLGGPKVRSFYSNILDPADDVHVTVDTHMIRAMMDDVMLDSKVAQSMRSTPGAKRETDTDISLGIYPLMADAIAQAAAKFEGGRYSPSEFQAIVWEQWKVEHPPVERRENTRARIAAGEMKRGGFQQASQDRKKAERDKKK